MSRLLAGSCGHDDLSHLEALGGGEVTKHLNASLEG